MVCVARDSSCATTRTMCQGMRLAALRSRMRYCMSIRVFMYYDAFIAIIQAIAS